MSQARSPGWLQRGHPQADQPGVPPFSWPRPVSIAGVYQGQRDGNGSVPTLRGAREGRSRAVSRRFFSAFHLWRRLKTAALERESQFPRVLGGMERARFFGVQRWWHVLLPARRHQSRLLVWGWRVEGGGSHQGSQHSRGCGASVVPLVLGACRWSARWLAASTEPSEAPAVSVPQCGCRSRDRATRFAVSRRATWTLPMTQMDPQRGLLNPLLPPTSHQRDASAGHAAHSRGLKTVESGKRQSPQRVWGGISGENRVKCGAARNETQPGHHAGVVRRPLVASSATRSSTND